jgi:hypothetical protein
MNTSNDTIDSKARGQVKMSMFVHVDEILTAFDNVDSRSRGTKTIASPEENARLTMIV